MVLSYEVILINTDARHLHDTLGMLIQKNVLVLGSLVLILLSVEMLMFMVARDQQVISGIL